MDKAGSAVATGLRGVVAAASSIGDVNGEKGELIYQGIDINGLEIIQPKPELNIATNFLYMLKGETPDEFDAHVLDVALILQADHELNASTFTARVVAGTLADMYSAVTAALGALSGPLHGGASTAIMKIQLEIGDIEPV